jgi:hypothetical protein
MSVELAIINRSLPHILEKKVESFLHGEDHKGCTPKIFPSPVALESPYSQILNHSRPLLNGPPSDDLIVESIPGVGDLVRLQIYISPDEETSWLNSELFLKQLSGVSNRIGFEIIGNSQHVHIGFLVHQDDLPFLKTGFRGTFDKCELSPVSSPKAFESLDDMEVQCSFIDFYPPPPYSHLMTRPDEFVISPYQPFVAALMEIPPPEWGFYQALFQPVDPNHNWHRNVETLLDIEYMCKLINSGQMPLRYQQQAPSGNINQMAKDVETKSHNDKPFFFMACRIGAISKQDSSKHLKSLSTFFRLFQHGGRPMKWITDQEYRTILSNDEIMTMFQLGLTYRSGFLVNSAEASGLVHIPKADILGFRNPPIKVITTLPVENKDIHEGTPLGSYEYAGKIYPVCIPLYLRSRSTHMIGKPGTGKSTEMIHMILDDIKRCMGLVVMDPHGDLIKDLICCIPEEYIERIIYFDLSIPGYVPIWNPLKRSKGQDISRTADDLLAAMKTVFSNGWGDRMEHILRHCLYAILHLPDSTFSDLSNLIVMRDKKSAIADDPLVQLIIEVLDNDEAIHFWKHDIRNYGFDALMPSKHRLSKLMLSGKTSLMLSQPHSLIDFRKIMDEGKILLVNLADIGTDVKEIVGCFILSLLHLTALGRSDTPIDKRRPFQIYLDEAHRFVTDTLEDLIAETRKFGVGITLAHHYLRQFDNATADALASVGSSIIMEVDKRDAAYLVKDMRDLFDQNDLTNMKVGEAIVRIGTDIVKINTLGKLNIPAQNCRDRIVQHSLDQYYKSTDVVKGMIREKNNRYRGVFTPISGTRGSSEEFRYDEF